MQTVSKWDNLHEMSSFIFYKKVKMFQMSSAQIFIYVQRAKYLHLCNCPALDKQRIQVIFLTSPWKYFF